MTLKEILAEYKLLLGPHTGQVKKKLSQTNIYHFFKKVKTDFFIQTSLPRKKIELQEH